MKNLALSTTSNRQQSILLGLIWSIGFFTIIVATVGMTGFHVDEITTHFVVQESFAGIADNRLRATHSPVYFWLMKPIAAIGGPPVLLRVPSVLFCSVALGTMTAVLSLHYGMRMATIFAFGLSTSPSWVYIAQYARPYALLATLLVFTICSLVTLLRRHLTSADENAPHADDSKWPWIVLVLSASSANLVMMAGVLHSLVLAVFPYLYGRLRHDKPFLKKWWLAMAPVLATATGMALLLRRSIALRADSYWAENRYPLSLATFRNVIENVFASGKLPETISAIIVISALILVVVSIFWLRRYPVLFWSSIPVGFGLPIVFLLISLKTSVMVPRYFYLVAPAWYILIAAGASVNWGNRWRSSLLAALALLVMFQFAVMLSNPDKNPRWAIFAAQVAQLNDGPEAILLRKHVHGRVLRFNFEHNSPPMRPIDIRSWGPHSGQDTLMQIADDLTMQYHRVWLAGGFKREEIEGLLDTSQQLASCTTELDRETVVILFRRDSGNLPAGAPCK